MRSICIIAVSCLVFLAGCQTMLPQVKAPLEDEGEVILYVQPFPQEADRLRFTVDVISARRNDGAEFPLSIKLRDLKGSEITRQRLLGSVQLPPGPYLGFSLKVKDASLKAEDGQVALLVPEVPARIDFPFNVSRKRAYVIALALQSRDSLRSGFGFTPLFSAYVPAKPLANLTGYATNRGGNNVTVFDKRAGQVAAAIATGGGPAGMALDQRTLKAYVALPDTDAIEVIDVTAGEIIDKIRLNVGDRPRELAITPDGKVLLTVNTGSNTVSFFDVPSLIESNRITVGNGPNSILMDSLGRRAYVFNNFSSSVSVIDIANRALVTNLSTDAGPLRGQFNRRGDAIYVIHEWSPYVSVIDTVSLSVAKRMYVGQGLVSIKTDTNTDLVYLAKARDSVVGVYEPFSFVAVDYLRVGGGIGYLTIDGDGNNLVMVSPDVQKVIAVNLISKKILWAIDVGEDPYWVNVTAER
jgi:YVTN family beta-propeller protein